MYSILIVNGHFKPWDFRCARHPRRRKISGKTTLQSCRPDASPFELVISDDASTDRTREIIREFEKKAPFPVIVNLNDPGKGFRDNFLSATPLTRGDWISFRDQDDVWHPEKLEICAGFMSIPGITQIVHQANLIDRNGKETGLFDQGIESTSVKQQMAYDIRDTFWRFSVLFDRRILDVVKSEERFIGHIDPGYPAAHDRWVHFLAQTLGHTIEIAKPLVGHRQHGNHLFDSQRPTIAKRSVLEIRQENVIHLAATFQMSEIVRKLPVGVEKIFPYFDRGRALEVYERAVRQLHARDKIYDGRPLDGIFQCLSMLCRGDYRNARNRSIPWRSLAEDLKVALFAAQPEPPAAATQKPP